MNVCVLSGEDEVTLYADLYTKVCVKCGEDEVTDFLCLCVGVCMFRMVGLGEGFAVESHSGM